MYTNFQATAVKKTTEKRTLLSDSCVNSFLRKTTEHAIMDERFSVRSVPRLYNGE
jgi:hypothetical protein